MRDQFWAEAVARYHAGERWFLDTDVLAQAAHEVVTDRFASDPWQEKIERFLLGRTETTLEEIFRICLTLTDISKWTQTDTNRISRCLAFAHWVRIRRGQGGTRRWVFMPGANAVIEPSMRPDVRPDMRPDVTNSARPDVGTESETLI